MKKTILGLTGPLASGKSTVARMFLDLGAAVLDTDAVVHGLQGAETDETKAIVQRFGTGVLGQDGAVDRAVLSGRIQEKETVLSDLEAILFPGVRKMTVRWLAEVKTVVAVVEAPMLFEAKLDRLCQQVVYCDCPPEIRKKRAMKRPGMTAAKYRALTARQMLDEEYKSRCQTVLATDNQQETQAQVKLLMQTLL
jgi:dephospho-CoA kinase